MRSQNNLWHFEDLSPRKGCYIFRRKWLLMYAFGDEYFGVIIFNFYFGFWLCNLIIVLIFFPGIKWMPYRTLDNYQFILIINSIISSTSIEIVSFIHKTKEWFPNWPLEKFGSKSFLFLLAIQNTFSVIMLFCFLIFLNI